VITDEQFKSFCKKHGHHKCFVKEDNTDMRTSYILLDEHLRFLDCSTNKKVPSKSILEVGVVEAMKQSGFDDNLFQQRGGIYNWSKEETPSASSSPCSQGGSAAVKDIEDLLQ